MTLDAGRVAEVWAPGTPSGILGSGYLLDGALVLTAGHVVDRAAGGRCEVRPLGSEEWLGAELEWRGSACDAALLRVAGGAHGMERAPLGRLASDARTPCRAVGFPVAQAKVAGRRHVRDTEDVLGEIAPLTGRKSGRMTVHIAGSVPLADGAGRSPWEGMSGAALESGGLLVGVVVVDPAHFGTDRLEAVPVSAMADEAGFRAALTGDPGAAPTLPAVEDVDLTRGVLRAPYRPLPPQASPEALRGGATGFLLEAEYGIVPFHGRLDELEELAGWCGDPGLGVRLLTGGGGTGKTRLAAELCRRRQAAGTVAGLLDAEPGRDRLAGLTAVRAPLLVVVDEAQSRLELTAALIRRLAVAKRRAATRVLLLARQAGDWWPHSLDELLGDDPDARFALAAAQVRELAPVDQGHEQRREAFEAAADAFARRLGGSGGALAVPDLSAPLFAPILFVHLAALTAVEGEGERLRGRVVGADLLAFALQREARYWASTARAHGVEPDRAVLAQAVAVATLVTASSHAEAVAALTAIPDLVDAPRRALRRLASWLRDLYPARDGAEWLRPLTPDLLAEALIASVLAEDRAPDLATELLRRSAAPKHALTLLTQAARSHPTARRALSEAVADQLCALWPAALEVAQETGDPIGKLLASALADAPQPELAVRIEEALPKDTVALRELAVVATQQSLDHVRRREPGVDRDAETAGLANNLSNRLRDVGRRDAALEAIEEAVAIRRRLAAENPETFLPDLATALSNRSSRLGDVGRDEDALAAIEEAVAIDRRLAGERPDDFLPGLAADLNNLSNRLGSLKRHEEALAAIEEALAIDRRLAQERPDEFLPGLAAVLSNLSGHLHKVGRREAALDAIEEAVAIDRRLAEERPDAYLPDLAGALNNQSNCLSALGRHEEALAAIEEAAALLVRVAAERPESFLPVLAGALVNVSSRLSDVARDEEALAAIDQAVAAYRRLANEHPLAFLPELAGSLYHQSRRLSDLERDAEALAAVEEAVAIDRRLAGELPDAYVPDLARSLGQQSTCLSYLGRHDEALDAIAEAVAIDRRLAEQRPHAFLADLASSLSAKSMVLSDAGRDEEALAAIEEAVAIRRRLAGENPDAFLPALARSLNSYSNRLRDLGRHDAALAPIEEANRLILPVLERTPHVLPDAGAQLMHDYLQLCRHLGRDPDWKLFDRMRAVLEADESAPNGE